MKKIDEIQEELKKLFLAKSEKVVFSIGQVFCDFNQMPSGILLINKGELRSIYKDKNSNISTIERFKTDDIVGAEQILCGTNEVAIKASTYLEAKFILKDDFLNYLKSDHQKYNYFSAIS